MKSPSAPRKSAVVPQTSHSNRRQTVSAPNASYDSDLDAHEDGGGDLPKKVQDDTGDAGGGAIKKAGGDANKKVGGYVNKQVGSGANGKVGGGVNKEVVSGANKEIGGNKSKEGSAAGDSSSKAVRKLTYSSAHKGCGGGVKGKVGIQHMIVKWNEL